MPLFRSAPLAPLGLLVVLGLLAACGGPRTYEVQGRVVGFGDDGRTLIIDHEAIDGLMPGMTMPFRAAEAGAADRFATGDAIRFTLAVTRDSTWIYDLAALPDTAVAASPSGTSLPVPEDTTRLAVGDALPPFRLVDQDERPVTPDDYAGDWLVVTFLYTRCPLPDYCPLLARQFAQLQPELRAAYGDRVRLLSVSIDPEHDTPEVLRAYAARYTDRTDTWRFATGTAEAVADLAAAFGILYAREDDGVALQHNLATALVDPDGRVREIWRGNRWRAADVLAALRTASGAPPIEQAAIR